MKKQITIGWHYTEVYGTSQCIQLCTYTQTKTYKQTVCMEAFWGSFKIRGDFNMFVGCQLVGNWWTKWPSRNRVMCLKTSCLLVYRPSKFSNPIRVYRIFCNQTLGVHKDQAHPWGDLSPRSFSPNINKPSKHVTSQTWEQYWKTCHRLHVGEF